MTSGSLPSDNMYVVELGGVLLMGVHAERDHYSLLNHCLFVKCNIGSHLSTIKVDL